MECTSEEIPYSYSLQCFKIVYVGYLQEHLYPNLKESGMYYVAVLEFHLEKASVECDSEVDS